MTARPPAQGLYDPAFEHDSCGVGFICHMKGKASNKIITDALQMLENMNHRGACGCEVNSGDGAGILVRTPDKFFRKEAAKVNIKLPKLGEYAVAMVFMTRNAEEQAECKRIFEDVVQQYGMVVLGWRDVPTDNSMIGPT